MNSFYLTIVTPAGCKFEGEVESINIPSTEGGVSILSHHANYVTTLGMGPARIGFSGGQRLASCIGGMFSITNNKARLIATSFEWADEIDVQRAQNALDRSEQALGKADVSDDDKALLEAARRRALVRISVANAKEN